MDDKSENSKGNSESPLQTTESQEDISEPSSRLSKTSEDNDRLKDGTKPPPTPEALEPDTSKDTEKPYQSRETNDKRESPIDSIKARYQTPEVEEDSDSLKDDTKLPPTPEISEPDTSKDTKKSYQSRETNDKRESPIDSIKARYQTPEVQEDSDSLKDDTKIPPTLKVSEFDTSKDTDKPYQSWKTKDKRKNPIYSIKSPFQTPEVQEDTDEKIPISQLPETPQGIVPLKKPMTNAKPIERFEIPEDVRKPTKSGSVTENSLYPESLKVLRSEIPKDTETHSQMSETKDDEQVSEQPATDDAEDLSNISETSKNDNDNETPEESARSAFRSKRKRPSIVTFFTGPTQPEGHEVIEEPPRRKRRPSFVKRKLIAFEKQLDFENINKKITRVFQLGSFGKDKTSDGNEKAEVDQEPPISHLSSRMACIFLISATTGSALASLPYFLRESSWFGVFLNLLLGFNALYAGLCTGWCWGIMEERWPEYLEYTRIPYQDMAYRAVGVWMKYFVTLCLHLAILGTCAGYNILIADSLENIIYKKFNFCYTLIVFSVFVSPFLMFSSYRNIKFIGVCDVLCSILFPVFLIISFFLDKPHHGPATYEDPGLNSMIFSLGGFSFAYGTGAIIPSILVDMTDRSLFTDTCATAYMICIVLYIVFPVMGYAAYGDETPRFILKNILSDGRYYNFGIVINIIHVIQLSTTYCVCLLPSLHSIEVRVNCPDRFGIFRFLLRTSVMVIMLVVILGVPYLPRYTDLVSATALSLVTFVFPPIFYVCLVYRTRTNSKKRTISKKEWVLIGEIILLGIVVVVASSYTLVETHSSFVNRESCFKTVGAIPEDKIWINNPKH